MKDKTKKLKAAMMGVIYFLQQEEEQRDDSAITPGPAPAWGHYADKEYAYTRCFGQRLAEKIIN